MTSDELEVWDEAQLLPDGLTIKHVHFKTGTPAFLIQHCLGTDSSGFERPNKKLAGPPTGESKLSMRPKQKNECAISKLQATMEKLREKIHVSR